MLRSGLFALWMVATCVGTAHAQGTDDERARAHFSSGTAYFDQARYEDAAREFEEAYTLSARPELLENVARAYERGMLFDRAIDAIERLRALHPESAVSLGQRIAALEALRDRVGGDDEDDEDDEDDATEAAPAPEEVVAPVARAPVEAYVSVPGLVTVIAGGVLGVVAIGTGIASQVLFDDVQRSCVSGECPTSRRGDADAGSALALTSTVLTFVAPVAIGVGILLLVLDGGPSRASEHARLEWTAGPGEIGLGARVSF